MAGVKGSVFRIGVTGCRGRLGSELVRRGCLALKCDITDPEWIRDVLRNQRPQAVIHCAAMTDVDGCENHPERAMIINALGTYMLCLAFKGPIVYLSTDYIFDGQDGPYDEEAKPNPLGWYGWSKLGGEVAIRQRKGDSDLIVRTTVLFDCYSENFVTTVTRKLHNGQQLALPGELVGSPTYVPHLADSILTAVKTGVRGIVNITGNRLMSRLEMGEYIARILEVDDQIHDGPVTGPAYRPQKAGLVLDRAHGLGLPLYDPLEGMSEVIRHAIESNS